MVIFKGLEDLNGTQKGVRHTWHLTPNYHLIFIPSVSIPQESRDIQ